MKSIPKKLVVISFNIHNTAMKENLHKPCNKEHIVLISPSTWLAGTPNIFPALPAVKPVITSYAVQHNSVTWPTTGTTSNATSPINTAILVPNFLIISSAFFTKDFVISSKLEIILLDANLGNFSTNLSDNSFNAFLHKVMNSSNNPLDLLFTLLAVSKTLPIIFWPAVGSGFLIVNL